MADHKELLERLALFHSGSGGIGTWLARVTDHTVLDRISRVSSDPITKVQLNQLLVLSHEAPVSFGFFKYYWLSAPRSHCYDVTRLPGYDKAALNASQRTSSIHSIDQFCWGMYRLFVDGLLFFGNVRSAFRALRPRPEEQITHFFQRQRFDTAKLLSRGPALPLETIPRDDRYLISEMACKSFGSGGGTVGDLGNAMANAYAAHEQKNGNGASATVRELLNGEYIQKNHADAQQQFLFSSDQVLERRVTSKAELLERYQEIAKQFDKARAAAVRNTTLYLSMVNELDVYVATSMRTRGDFREVADRCDRIFADPKVTPLNLRYFDPTLSAADGHEDKGLIECLMVKCCKALVYCAGSKDSFGKDAEAAMALSLGKPVICLCDEGARAKFFRDVHPLSRLINFQTGVAVGAMVTHELQHVAELLRRLMYNEMEYVLEQHPQRPGYIRLKEKLTDSIVRLHTDDRLLAETFWNHYNERRSTAGDIRAHF